MYCDGGFYDKNYVLLCVLFFGMVVCWSLQKFTDSLKLLRAWSLLRFSVWLNFFVSSDKFDKFKILSKSSNKFEILKIKSFAVRRVSEVKN